MKESTPAAWMGLARRSLLSFLIAICVAVGGSLLDAVPTSAIIGGDPAEGDGAVLRVDVPGGSCSGFLYKPRIVVTAAHCFWVSARWAGTPGLITVKGTQVHAVGASWSPTGGIEPVAVFLERIFIFDVNRKQEIIDYKKDIAFLVFDRDLGQTNIAGAVSYDEFLRLRRESLAVEVVGYGCTQVGGDPSSIPRKLSWTIRPTLDDPYTVNHSQSNRTCPGDSGGLVSTLGKDGQRLAIGVVGGDDFNEQSQQGTLAIAPINFDLLGQAEVLAGYSKSVPMTGLGSRPLVIKFGFPNSYGSLDRKLIVGTNYVVEECWLNKELPSDFKGKKVEYAVKVGNSWRKIGEATLRPRNSVNQEDLISPCGARAVSAFSFTSLNLDRNATLFSLSESRRLIEVFAEKSGWKKTLLKAFGPAETSATFDFHVQECPCVAIGYRFSGEKDFVGEVLVPAKR